MKDIRTQEQIDEMRQRLYDRGSKLKGTARHQLTDIKVDVARNWGDSPAGQQSNTTDLRAGIHSDEVEDAELEGRQPIEEEPEKPKRHYRGFVLIGSLIIFILVAGVSSLYLYFGGNQISNDNIGVAISGPRSIGGGEVLSLQVGVTNQNSVPIESATLILQYPEGSRSAGDDARSLTEERIPLEIVTAGEVQNVPVRVAIFGEENAELAVNATVEYRIQGSNGMFYKESAPHEFIISSSPLVLRVDSIERVASGQFVDITLTAVSNGSNPLRNLLITASYPNGFDFQSSDPAPVYSENVWRIPELLPEEQQTITISGLVSGLTDSSFVVNFDIGQEDEDEQFAIDTSLADARADFYIERPFIDVGLVIGREWNGLTVLPEGSPSQVRVNIGNTLDETVYDMVVEATASGNAIGELSIEGGSGFYDSNRDAVRWEVSNVPSLEAVTPGAQRTLFFSIAPNENRITPEFEVTVNVFAQRVDETSAQEQLIGTSRAKGIYSGSADVGVLLGRGTSEFEEVGSLPLTVGEFTTYTVTLVAEAGANDIEDAVVETSFPIYMEWMDNYIAESGDITYNPVTKRLQWVVGDIPRRQQRTLDLQLGIRPSISQVGEVPIIVNDMNLRANDGFTGVLHRDQIGFIRSNIRPSETFPGDNGVVVR